MLHWVLAKPWIASRSSISMVQPIVFQSRCCSGWAFAWMTAKLARRIYQHRMETSARITLIRERNNKIRRAVKAITPVPYPKNQQAIRVIRKEADRIEGALTEINASAAASRSFTRRPKA